MTAFKNGPAIANLAARPGEPSVGETIFDPDAASYRYWTGTRWEGIPPVGIVEPFAGATAPPGWLLCHGQAVSRTTYADLFGVIGEIYGGGNGTTTFNVPDLRGRSVHGRDNMGRADINGDAANRVTHDATNIEGRALGSTGGSQYMQVHEHTYSVSGNTQADTPDHAHQWTLASAGNAQGTGDLPFRGYNIWDNNFQSGGTAAGPWYGSAARSYHNHTYSWSGSSNSHGLVAGSGENVPPTRVFAFIIKH